MKKYFLCFLSFLCITAFAFADDDDLDSMFEDATDVVTEQKEEAPPVVNYFKALRFSGHLESELGLYDSIYNHQNDVSGYFTLTNYLYFSARADKTLGINGSIKTRIPNDNYFELYELYFDYLMFDRIYLTAGKKATTWGYTRLFSDDSKYGSETYLYGNEQFRPLYTNVLTDSINKVSAQIRIPLFTGTITGIAMHSIYFDNADISYDSFDYAASIEMTLFHTSMNLFGRKYAYDEEKGETKPVIGFEMKRTILGADVYAQELTGIADFKKITQKDGIDKIIVTSGFYKWWDSFDPNIGMNAEYQFIYNAVDNTCSHLIAFDGGVKRLGPNKNIKVGISANHDIVECSGNASLGVIISGVLPHADLNNAIKVYYGDQYVTPKIQFGSIISLALDY